MLLIEKKDFKISGTSRIVKAEEVGAFLKAEEIIANAEEYAEQLRNDAVAAFEAEKVRGYNEGFSQGKAKIAADKLDFVYESSKQMEKIEEKLADVVIKALWKCVSQIGDRNLIMDIIRKLMKAVIQNQRHVILKVAPDMVEEVKSRIDEILVDYPALERVDVEEDSRLKGTAAILETEAGIADASIESQLRAIEASIHKHFSKDER